MTARSAGAGRRGEVRRGQQGAAARVLAAGVVERTGLKIQFQERLVDIEPRAATASSCTTSPAQGCDAQRAAGHGPARHAAQAGRAGGGQRQGGLPAGRCRQQYRGQGCWWWAAATARSRPRSPWPAQPGTATVTLSYRGAPSTRVKAKNRLRLEQAAAQSGRVRVLLGSVVDGDRARPGAAAQEADELRPGNDAVIVCAGGQLPTPCCKKSASASRPSTGPHETAAGRGRRTACASAAARPGTAGSQRGRAAWRARFRGHAARRPLGLRWCWT
jgi:hypothetical protein